MKAGLDKEKIIEVAARLADEKGIANVTMKVLAAELGIKSPSLYKHFSGGLFEAMQWYNMYQSEVHLQATEGTVSILFQVLESYGLTEEQKVHIVRMLRGFLQGFTSIESHGGYGHPIPLDDTFDFGIKTILNGIRDLEGGIE